METGLDPKWIAVLEAIDELRKRGEVPGSDNLQADIRVLDQMLNGRWITGVVIRANTSASRERIVSIDLTSLGRKALAERGQGQPGTPSEEEPA